MLSCELQELTDFRTKATQLPELYLDLVTVFVFVFVFLFLLHLREMSCVSWFKFCVCVLILVSELLSVSTEPECQVVTLWHVAVKVKK